MSELTQQPPITDRITKIHGQKSCADRVGASVVVGLLYCAAGLCALLLVAFVVVCVFTPPVGWIILLLSIIAFRDSR